MRLGLLLDVRRRKSHYAAPTAKIAVHSLASMNGKEDDNAKAGTVEMARFSHDIGVPDAIVVKMIDTPPAGMAWLDQSDLKAMNTVIYGPHEAAAKAT